MDKEMLIIRKAKEVSGQTGIPFHICVIRICKDIGEDYRKILSIAGRRSSVKRKFTAVRKEISEQFPKNEESSSEKQQLTFGFGG